VNRAVRDGVLRIELPGTPLDATLAAQLLDAIPPADNLDAPAVLLLCAPPGGEFAGLGVGDVDGGTSAEGGVRVPVGLRDGFPGGVVSRCVEALAAYTGISVAALSGDARGCGAELVIAADLRVAWSGARLGFPHVSFGLVPTCGATQRMPRLIGPGVAFSALLLGGEIAGDDMVGLGLAAQSLTTPQEALAAAEQLAARLAAQSATALRACKEAVLSGVDLTLRDGLRLEADLAVLLQSTHDRAEGISAFLEKRAPRFEGR
jgi:enoyl-CoA hydratase/carnithine racemase